MMKNITDVMKKDNENKWTIESKDSFEKIKKAIEEFPVLVSLDYEKPFLIFSFSSKNTIVVFLLQKNDNGHEQPISFLSKALRDVELKYSFMEKCAYAMVKYLKDFRDYVTHSRIIDPYGYRWPPTYSNWFILEVF